MAAIRGVLALIAVVVAHMQGWNCTALLLALAPAIAFWQLQEFFRRVLYTEGRTGAALATTYQLRRASGLDRVVW